MLRMRLRERLLALFFLLPLGANAADRFLDCESALSRPPGLRLAHHSTLFSPTDDQLLLNTQLAILHRTEPLRREQPAPYLVDLFGRPVNVLIGMEREFALPILQGSKEAVKVFISRLAKAWLEASLQEFKVTPPKEIIGTHTDTVDYLDSVAIDADGVPLIPLFQRTHAISQKVVASHLEARIRVWPTEEAKRRLKKDLQTWIAADPTLTFVKIAGEDTKIAEERAREIKVRIRTQEKLLMEQNLEKYTEDARRELEAGEHKEITERHLRNKEVFDLARQVLQRAMEKMESTYSELVEQVGDPIIAPTEHNLVKKMEKGQITDLEDNSWWKYAVVRGTHSVVIDMIHELQRSYPLPHLLAKQDPDSIEAIRLEHEVKASDTPKSITELVPTAVMNDGVPELILSTMALRVYYDKSIGTTRLEPKKKAAKNALLFIPLHGAGTVRSNVKSWASLSQGFVKDGFNPFPFDLPYAGMGMEIAGLRETTAYLDLYFRKVRQDNPQKPDQPLIPLGLLGRSMGAIEAVLHGMLRGGADDVVDYRVVMSTSLPHTIGMQTKNVLRQVRQGVLDGYSKQSLGIARQYQMEAAKVLDLLESLEPSMFSHFGDGILFTNGMDDEDGGPTVIEDMRTFIKRFAPLGHLYVFENVLRKYKLPHMNRVSTEMQEAKHFLLSPRSNIATREEWESFLHFQKQNMTPEQWEEFYVVAKEIPPEDWPKLRDQYVEYMALFWGYLDHLADSHSKVPSEQKSRANIRPYRDYLCGAGKTFFEWYCEKMGLKRADVDSAQPGRNSVVQRLKKVQTYWLSENSRVNSLLSQMGLLEE